MNKVLVRIYFPLIEKNYDIWLPISKTVYNVIILLSKIIDELKDYENFRNNPFLYNRYSGICYNMNIKIKDTDITNGTELIFI